MDYPTRERVEFAMRQPDTLMYEKDSLEGVVFVAQQNMLKKIGGVLLAMHDALDAKQAELDKAFDTINTKQVLIADMVAWFKWFQPYPSVCVQQFIDRGGLEDEPDEDLHSR